MDLTNSPVETGAPLAVRRVIKVTRWSAPGQYSLSGKTPNGGWSLGAGSYQQAWRTLSDLSMGAQLARDHEANKEES